MSYAAIMVYVDAVGMPERRVRLAVELADKFSATLIGLSAIAFRPPMMVEGILVNGTTESETQDMSASLASKGSWFRSVAGSAHLKLEWRPIFDFPADALAREARCTDLIVLPQMTGSGDTYSSLDPGGAILRLGRPALVVPDRVDSLQADHVVIGWKDAREARRAVRDSLPFLHRASRVTIVEICRPDEQETALERMDDVGRYLTHHQIDCGPMITLEQKGSGADQLIEIAQGEKSDLLVVGAYGHSRLGEWVFGGMTRDLLSKSPMCCLMSH
jgi:nucleotide-binding universal stress UspA family protein